MMLLIIALSVSIDSLVVGVSLSMKNIRIPIYTYFYIGLIFLLFALLGHSLPLLLLNLVKGFTLFSKTLNYIGNVALMAMGVYYIKQSHSSKPPSALPYNPITQPSKADLDSSGTLDMFESGILAVILSIDTVIAIIGLSLSGSINYFQSAMFAIIQSVLMIMGIIIGKYIYVSLERSQKFLSCIPGYILLAVGFFRFLL